MTTLTQRWPALSPFNVVLVVVAVLLARFFTVLDYGRSGSRVEAIPLDGSIGAAYGWRARIGMLQPTRVSDTNPYEFYLMAPRRTAGADVARPGRGTAQRGRV